MEQLEKLYYKDCHLRSFEAQVLSCREVSGGWEITLDRTAFYPEGGGQACDLGTLGTVQVLHVREEGEQVVHLCDGALEVGTTVCGEIDWARRFDLMQQHTGEHMVSGILYKRYGVHNTGFHMGIESITIDFDKEIPPADLPEIERIVNEAVWQNLPVKCWYPSEEELPQVFYRTKKALPWPVRIVQVGDVDSCACCGVHVAHTGEVGLVKLFSCIKFRTGSRIEMLCGQRALAYLNKVWQQNALVSHAFSAKPLETGGAAEKANEVIAQLKYRITGLENRVFDSIAAGCQGDTVLFEPGLDAVAVRRLAEAVAQHCGALAAVFSEKEDGYAYALVHHGGDLRELCKAMNQALAGRGGGKGGFCQGSVKADEASIRSFFSGEK